MKRKTLQRENLHRRRLHTAAVRDLGASVARGLRASDDPARRGMVLLFVVVLLTLLAVMGGAYLISSRIDNSQVNPSARGGEANPYGLDAADRVDQIMASAQTAASRKLFLDSFAYNGIVPASGGAPPAHPSAQRIVGDDSGDLAGVNNRDANGNIVGDGAPDLIWRPSDAQRNTFMPLPGAAPAPDQLGVFPPMAAFFPFTPVRPMYDRSVPAGTSPGLTVHFPYYHVDALGGTDTHLASRLPVFDNFRATPLNDFIWPWISGPIVGVPDFPVDNLFLDPFSGRALNFDPDPVNDPAGLVHDLRRAWLLPTTFGPVEYGPPADVASLSSTNADFYNDRLRTWPALLGDFDQNGTPLTIVAADADGDGVADAGLVPIVFNENAPIGSLDRYTDPQTGYVYFVAVRIVDNNAAVNVNTALSRYGDVQLPVDPALLDLAAVDYESGFSDPVDAAVAPNRGIHLSNIGLFELFAPGGLPSGGGNSRSDQFASLLPALLGNPLNMPVGNTTGLSVGGVPLRSDMQMATLGELLSMNRDRFLDNPVLAANGTDLIAPFRSMEEAGALAFKGGGWLIPDSTPTRLENVVTDALRIAAGNYSPNPKMQFEHFPLGPDMGVSGETQAMMRALWVAQFKHADPDMTLLPDFESFYATGSFGGTRFDPATTAGWPLSPRAALVTHNGVGQAFRPHTLFAAQSLADPNLVPQLDMDANGQLEGMPPYAPDGSGIEARPPVRASVNTAGFSELWRAFWNVMVEQRVLPDFDGNPVLVTHHPGAGLGAADPRDTTFRMFRNDLFEARAGAAGFGAMPTEYQVLTLRAALAAINTLDIRDVEDIRITHPGDDGAWGAPAGAVDDAHPVPTAADIMLLPSEPEDVNGNGTLDPGEDLDGDLLPDPNGPAFFARVAGSEAQPFITEVFMTFLPAGGSQYLGIELYNPYPFPLKLDNWYLIATTRLGTGAIDTSATGIKNLSSTVDQDFTLALNVTIPPNSYVVIQNEAPPSPILIDPLAQAEGRVYTGPPTAPGQPGGISMPTGSSRLQSGPTGDVNREVVLMRPLDTNGLADTALRATDVDDLLARWVPADCFNPTGIFPSIVAPPPGSDPRRWRYVRPNGISEDRDGDGVLDPAEDVNGNGVLDPGEDLNGNGVLDPAEDTNGNGIIDAAPDQRGWRFVSHGAYTAVPAPGYGHTAGLVPVPLATEGGLGKADPDAHVAPEYDGNAADGVLVTRSLPWGPVLSGPMIADDGSGAPKPLYPYGGFARDGDALGIPFFGAYRIYRDGNAASGTPGDSFFNPATTADPTGDELLDLVPPTLDAAFVDADTTAATTHLGRFIPQNREDGNNNGAIDGGEDVNLNGRLDDFAPAGATADAGYDWAADFFEYITALHAPGSDALPHVDNRYYYNRSTSEDLDGGGTLDPGEDLNGNNAIDTGADNAMLVNPQSVPMAGAHANALFQALPAPINNDALGAPNDFLEAFLPVEGRINLNTADFGILKLLPLAVDNTGTITPGGAAASRISGSLAANSPATPADGLAGSVYLGRSGRAYDSLLRLNGLPEDFAARSGAFRDHRGAALVDRRFGGDFSGARPRVSEDKNANGTLDPGEDTNGNGTLDAWFPTFAELASDASEDANGNGVLDAGEDADGDGRLDPEWYFDVGMALGITGHYEDDTVQLARISNLTTLRSDSYTVHITVQAWENVGQPAGSTTPGPARLVRQARSAFIVDRSGILPFKPDGTAWSPADVNGDAWRDALKITPVPVK